MDSTITLDLVTAGAGADTVVNEALDALSPAAIYGKRASTSTGLTWGYYGGRWGGTSIANGTLALTLSTTNYVVVNLTTGAVSVSTSTTNWNDTANYARAYKIVAGASTVTSYEDHRAGVYGTLNAAATTITTVGRHAVPIVAAAMSPTVSGGCAVLAGVASGSGKPDIITLDFDASTQENAQFSIPMPKSWNEGTVTAKFIWSHAATTTNFGVVWSLQGVALSDADAIATSYGTAQQVVDTGGSTDTLYHSPETPAITIAGTPAAEDLVYFRVSRVAANGSDTLAVDARLHAVVLYLTTDAGTDA